MHFEWFISLSIIMTNYNTTLKINFSFVQNPHTLWRITVCDTIASSGSNWVAPPKFKASKMLYQVMLLILSNPVCKLLIMALLLHIRNHVNQPVARKIYTIIYVLICYVFDVFFVTVLHSAKIERSQLKLFVDFIQMALLIGWIEAQAVFHDIDNWIRGRLDVNATRIVKISVIYTFIQEKAISKLCYSFIIIEIFVCYCWIIS